LTALQGSNLSKLDVEHIVILKWQNELDPRIQSHYNLKYKVSNKFDDLQKTIHSTIDTSLQNNPLLSII